MRTLFLVLLYACSTALAADEPSFVNEGIIPAPIDEVWKVFATSEGYKALGPALADVDLRFGGLIRSRYRADGVLGDAETIENVIVDYRAPATMTIRISKTPASFPFKEAWESTWTVLMLTPTDEGTHLRAESYGRSPP
jgi:uncharacterized protein YndB with AHSA1/START domain